VAGAILSFVPVGVSIAYYAAEDRVDSLSPAGPVRLQGVLLRTRGCAPARLEVLFATQQSVTAPVGALFALAFAYLLLTVDRT